jgi:hypothetical protein
MDSDPQALASQYGTLTDNVVSFLNTNVGSFGDWQNTPGVLTFVQNSTGGYVWGIGYQGIPYFCKQPCTGQWTPKPVTTDGTAVTPISLQVDAANVYYLVGVPQPVSDRVIYVTPINGSGTWTKIASSADILNATGLAKTSLGLNLNAMGVTNSLIWVSATDLKTGSGTSMNFTCTKPCSTNNWVQNINIATPVQSFSSSGSKLYGVTFDPTLGKNIAFASEETGSNLEQIAGMAGIAPQVISGQSDSTNILAVDSTNKLYGCTPPCQDPSNLYEIPTNGYPPTTAQNSVSLANNQIWMVSGTSGTNGNIFQRLDMPDATTILSSVGAFDTQRDNIAQSLKNEYNTQTSELTAAKQINDAMDTLQQAITMDKTVESRRSEAQKIKREIQQQNERKQGFTNKFYPIQILALTLLVSALVYGVLGAILPKVAIQGLVALLLTVGFGATIYFYVTNNTDGQSAVQRILPTP